VVAKAILEVVRHKRTQRITLILTLLLKHIRASEDIAIELLALNEAQLTLLGIHQILRNADIVEQIPRILITKVPRPARNIAL